MLILPNQKKNFFAEFHQQVLVYILLNIFYRHNEDKLRQNRQKEEKDVFKTSMEIDQRWVIEHAATRQQFIDQAQSLNLFFRPDVNIKYLHAVHFLAWKQGLKTLYYCRSEKLGKADKVSNRIERQIIKEISMTSLVNDDECLACEG